MKVFTRPCLYSLVGECVGDFMNAVPEPHIVVINLSDDNRFIFANGKIFLFVAFFVEPPALYEHIPIRSGAAFVMTLFHQQPQTRSCAYGRFFAFTVSLPKADIVHQLVGVGVKPLFALVHAPYPDIAFYEPFHHKGRFVRNPADTVKHEHKEYIKLFRKGKLLDILYAVAFFSSYLMSRYAVLAFLMDEYPPLLFQKASARLPLHKKGA